MQEYYPLEVWVLDYQKEMMDSIEEYNHREEYRESVKKEAERLRNIYDEITSKVVYSKRFKGRKDEGTKYFYATKEEYDNMQEKKYWWWSDLLSVTVGND